MKLIKNILFCFSVNNLNHVNSTKLLAAFILSFALISCGGGGSSNVSDSSKTDVECSDGFGDASRCSARSGL